MAEGAILWDSNLRIVEVNAEAERIFGLPREQLEGQPYRFAEWSVRPPWEHIRLDGTTKPEEELGAFQAFHNKCEVRNIEFGHKWYDGRIIWINASAVPVLDDTGEIDCILCTFSDVTEQKQLRDEREYYLTQVTRAQEEERKRISRELHDDAAQHLSLLSLGIDHLISHEKEMSQEFVTELRRLHKNAEEALRKISRVIMATSRCSQNLGYTRQ
jgi:PAS domain S-box-containing protein